MQYIQNHDMSEFGEEKPSSYGPEFTITAVTKTFNYFIDYQKAKNSIESLAVDTTVNLGSVSENNHDNYILNDSLEFIEFDSRNYEVMDMLVNNWPEKSDNLTNNQQLVAINQNHLLSLSDSSGQKESIAEIKVQLKKEIVVCNYQIEMHGLLDRIYGMKFKYADHNINIRNSYDQNLLDSQYEML